MPRLSFRWFRAPWLFACAFGACSAGEERSDSTNVPPPRPARAGVYFHPDTVKPGSEIGTLRVDSIRMRDVAGGRDADIAYFTGELTLTGQTLRHPDADLGLTTVCFEADSTSAALMPRWTEDLRRSWFCFSNQAEAARTLAPPGAIVGASIVIDRFINIRGSSDEVNHARLVRVVTKGSAALGPGVLPDSTR
jgi:hypothetical protein